MIRIPLLHYTFTQSLRRLIVPEPITTQSLDHLNHVNSTSYSFVLSTNPRCDLLYEHLSDTPSNLLSRNAIHIFSDSVSDMGVKEKYNAHLRRLREQYNKSFEKCSTPSEIFHLERRIKADIKNKCKLIGKVSGRYKHHPMFQSLDELRAVKTAEEYRKNGVKLDLLNGKKIYPQGPVWLPTNQDYLRLFQNFIISHPELKPASILDLGCGSGILSYLCAKIFKNSQIVAIDHNIHAVETCEINAASLGLTQIKTCHIDFTKDLDQGLLSKGVPTNYDLIVSNPPWIACKRSPRQSIILDGVYDEEGKCLESSFVIAARKLKNRNSRLILVYSDLGKILGLEKKSVEQLAQQNNLIVHSKQVMPYAMTFGKQSPLNAFKERASIELYEISLI